MFGKVDFEEILQTTKKLDFFPAYKKLKQSYTNTLICIACAYPGTYVHISASSWLRYDNYRVTVIHEKLVFFFVVFFVLFLRGGDVYIHL